jgi:ribulose-phosphate 3-epimerase
MATICPTVTAFTTTEYRQQLERIQQFALRIHIDFMDGNLSPTVSPSPSEAWWQPGPKVDLHVMYQKPLEILEDLVALQPQLIIIHAEAEGIRDFLIECQDLGIALGLALLQQTKPKDIIELLPLIDHVLIFSGNLGHFGGVVDLTLLDKVKELKKYKPNLEIGWDGGINSSNAATLVNGGVDVLNTGGYIQKATNPEEAYDTLVKVIEGK